MADNRTTYDKKLYKSPIYVAWTSMKTRCKNPNYIEYHRYGGRGIKYCSRWESFANFYNDMHMGYRAGLSLDRIDNNGDYTPENCRWATRTDQARNTRNTEQAKKYSFNGFKYTVRELSELFGIKRTTLDMRLRHYGWSIEESLTGKRG